MAGGTTVFPDGSRFTGHYVEGKPQPGGAGIIILMGAVTGGELAGGLPHGRGGTLTFPDKSRFVGEFINGEPTSSGTFIMPDGTEYTGEVSGAVPMGGGTAVFPDGSRFVGDYVDGRPAEWGKHIYADGSEYEGSVKDGRPHGEGTTRYSDGAVFTGEHRSGEAVQGSIYLSQWQRLHRRAESKAPPRPREALLCRRLCL